MNEAAIDAALLAYCKATGLLPAHSAVLREAIRQSVSAYLTVDRNKQPYAGDDMNKGSAAKPLTPAPQTQHPDHIVDANKKVSTQTPYGVLLCEGCGKPMPQTAVPAEKVWCEGCSTKTP